MTMPPVQKEPMARRLTVHKVIESVLHLSDDHESGIEDPRLSLPIGIPYSNLHANAIVHHTHFLSQRA